jgi:hypothetical protein
VRANSRAAIAHADGRFCFPQLKERKSEKEAGSTSLTWARAVNFPDQSGD